MRLTHAIFHGLLLTSLASPLLAGENQTDTTLPAGTEATAPEQAPVTPVVPPKAEGDQSTGDKGQDAGEHDHGHGHSHD